MRTKLIAGVLILLMVIEIVACNKNLMEEEVVTTANEIDNSYSTGTENVLEALFPEGEMSFDELASFSSYLFSVGSKGYRVELDFSKTDKIPYYNDGDAFLFDNDDDKMYVARMYVSIDEQVIYVEYDMEEFIAEEYQGFTVYAFGDNVVLIYPLPDETGYISIPLYLTQRFDRDQDDYHQKLEPVVHDIINAVTITELDSEIVERAPGFFASFETDDEDIYIYPKAAILRFDEVLAFDLTKIYTDYKTSAHNNEMYLSLMDFCYTFDINYIGTIHMVPEDMYEDTRSAPWSFSADCFQELIEAFAVEVFTIGDVEFLLCDHEFETVDGSAHNYYFIYQGSDFSVLYRVWEQNEGSPSIEKMKTLLARLVV